MNRLRKFGRMKVIRKVWNVHLQLSRNLCMLGLKSVVLCLIILVKFPFSKKLSVYFMNLTVSYYAELCPSIGRVRVKHRGVLLTLKGTVIRSGSIKMIEGEREYECRKCKKRLLFIKLLFSIAIKHYYL